MFHKTHKESEKTIKSFLEADGAGEKTEPYIKPILFLHQLNVLTYTNMKTTWRKPNCHYKGNRINCMM